MSCPANCSIPNPGRRLFGAAENSGSTLEFSPKSRPAKLCATSQLSTSARRWSWRATAITCSRLGVFSTKVRGCVISFRCQTPVSVFAQRSMSQVSRMSYKMGTRGLSERRSQTAPAILGKGGEVSRNTVLDAYIESAGFFGFVPLP